MLSKLLHRYDQCFNHYVSDYWLEYYTPATLIVAIVKNNSYLFGGFVRKGQEQLMADYLMLALLEQGRL